jgi:hypothetical protein
MEGMRVRISSSTNPILLTGRWLGRLLALGLLCFGSTGCGVYTIRTWINVIEEESTGSVDLVFFGQPATLALSRLQGGLQGLVQIDTRELLEQPLEGNFFFEDVRIAAQGQGALGKVCTWLNPSVLSGGVVQINLLGGGSGNNQASVIMNLRATSQLQQGLGLGVASLVQGAQLPIGEGLSLQTFLDAQTSGDTSGLFASSAQFSGSTKLGGIPATFNLNLELTNGPMPPEIDADHRFFCNRYFFEQGADFFYGMNSKSTYLRAESGDTTAPPLAIPLAALGATPGWTLRLKHVGTYSDLSLLEDGTETRATAVFSSSDEVLDDGERYRIPGAIEAGAPNVNTGSYFECFLIFCSFQSSDIPEDFRIDPTIDVVVPEGAQYLFVSPTPSGQWWEDNSGFAFGVSVEVR